MPRPLAILKAGSTEPGVRAERGDFEEWFREGLEWPTEFVHVYDLCSGARPPAPAAICGVVVTGSSAMLTDGEAWSEDACRWLADGVARELPVLGICYGHQMLAAALGGRVDWNPRGREIGTVQVELTIAAHTDPLLAGLASPLLAQESHSQSVVELPPGAVHLARNDHDPNQGFRFGSRAWGFQFHPEFDADVQRGYLESRRAKITAEGLDVDALLGALRETPAAREILARFGRLVREER